ncbi:MAG: hypothetical protein ACI8Z1_001404 [Candidatus Azotimanducaceae bacterium]|jgi:hypothetical protein
MNSISLKKWLIITALLSITACETVQPWERGTLARPEMQLESDSLAAKLTAQVYNSKEASTGSANPAGAGCGCN